MANLFSGINARFRGTGSKTPAPKSPGPSNAQLASPNQPGLAPVSPNLTPVAQNGVSPISLASPRIPPLPNSPPLAEEIGLDANLGNMSNMANGEELLQSYHLPRPLPLWLNNSYGKHIVKGNFMTLSARPKVVEPGEWIAHHVVEHYRNLWHFVSVVHDEEEDGSTICNPTTCPRTSAGENHSFTWLNSKREPVELPAHEYMSLMQRWISGKTNDTHIFPTDPDQVSYALNPNITTGALAQLSQLGEKDWVGKRSGFPDNFAEVCQTIFRQMFRVYAHLYWSHFITPFYHLNMEKQLNSCFSHFILTATALDMLVPRDLEPMQALIDLWAANGTFPPESKAYQYANLKVGEWLMQATALQ